VLLPAPSGLRRSRLFSYVLLARAQRRDAPRAESSVGAGPDLQEWLRKVAIEYPGKAGDIRTDRGAFNLSIRRDFRDWGTAWSSDAWDLMIPVLSEMARLADLHDFQLRIVCFPLRAQVEAEYTADEPQRILERVAADLHAPYLDLLPVLHRAWRAGNPDLFFDHCHPTPAGHEVVAEAMLSFLRAP
jgi:hypothetical protein